MRFSELLKLSGLDKYAVLKQDGDLDKFSPLVKSDIEEKWCVFLKSSDYIGSLSDRVGVVITTEEIGEQLDPHRYGICISSEPRGLFFELLDVFERNRIVSRRTEIGFGCQISDSAKIAKNNVKIGNNVVIGDNTMIEEGTIIEDDTVINSGCLIGAQNYLLYSFGGKNKQVMCRGNTFIGKNSIILHDSIIGRAAYDYDSTIIGDRCKIGIHVGIGHNSKIGNDVGINSACNIAGNVHIGDGAVLYMACTVLNRLNIGEKAVINAGSVVVKDVSAGEKWMGNPARKLIK